MNIHKGLKRQCKLSDTSESKKGDENMNTLKRCPECNSELKMDRKDMQFCSVCGYWTKKGTARVDSIMIF